MKSTSDWRSLPGELLDILTEEDWLLLEQLVPQNLSLSLSSSSIQLPLFSRLDFASIIKDIYPQFQSLAVTTLSRNLKEGAHYCAGGRPSSTKSYPNFFAKNLIRMYHWVSDSHAPYTTAIGFPRESGYSLLNEKNWLSIYPPHEDLHCKILQKLYSGIDSRLLTFTSEKSLKLSHFDNQGHWLLDACLISSHEPSIYWFIETYTGTEGFGKFLTQRLLTAYYNHLQYSQHRFVFLLPKEQDVKKFWSTYTKISKAFSTTPPFCYAYSYRRLDNFKSLLGISPRSNRSQS